MGKQSRRAWRKQHDKLIRERLRAEAVAKERRLKGFQPATPGETLALASARATQHP
jgi:hypothetical protein